MSSAYEIIMKELEECHKVITQLRAERDRYKTALESIADAPNWTHKGGWDLLSELLPIAHKALEANND